VRFIPAAFKHGESASANSNYAYVELAVSAITLEPAPRRKFVFLVWAT